MQIKGIDHIVTHAAETSAGFFRKLGFSGAGFVDIQAWTSPPETILGTVPLQCKVNSTADYFTLKRTVKQLRSEVCRIFR